MYIYKAAVLGGGTMGGSIAQVITFSGIPVVIKDIDQNAVQKALDKVRSIYESRVKKGKMTASEIETKIVLASGTTSYDDFSDVDIVIEAVPEEMKIKKIVFKELDEVCQPGITSTNFITWAGLKKCMPTTFSGRLVAEAISEIDSAEVLLARMVLSGQAWSSSLKTIFLIFISSGTASMTISTSEKSS